MMSSPLDTRRRTPFWQKIAPVCILLAVLPGPVLPVTALFFLDDPRDSVTISRWILYPLLALVILSIALYIHGLISWRKYPGKVIRLFALPFCLLIVSSMMIFAIIRSGDSAAHLWAASSTKIIGMSMQSHLSSKGFFPKDICDKNGTKLLSWRVAFLPFLDENRLYKQFKLDEPWDSPHNIKLLKQMPPSFESFGDIPIRPFETYFQRITGPGTGMDGTRLGSEDFPDGLGSTILITESSVPVPWTKPEDIVVHAEKPLPKFGPPTRRPFLFGWIPRKPGLVAGMASGELEFIDQNHVSERPLRAMITRSAGDRRIGQDEVELIE